MEIGSFKYIIDGQQAAYVRRVNNGMFSILEFNSISYTYGITGDLVLWRMRRGKDAIKIKHLHPLELPGLNLHYYLDGYISVSYDLPDNHFHVWVLKDGAWQ